ncbi:MAG: hypothetical protein PVSMB5_26950 [Ktedonobacteraceae bacterium]
MDVSTIAAANVERLRENPYPGRGLVIGRSAVEDAWLIIYWIMGRSVGSRNRKFVVEGSTLRTEPIDARALDNPQLLIYAAMLELPNVYLVAGSTFGAALEKREREPDAPHYTPRISGMLNLQAYPGDVTLSILKANQANAALTDRFTYHPARPPHGYGVGLTTYRGDGNPLPSFSGDPLLLPCAGSAEQVLEAYWSTLNAENRVAIAVKHIAAQDGASRILMRNRFVA